MERRGGASQGEPLAVWAMWAVVLAMILRDLLAALPDTADATDDLYHVSGNGLVGGLSRVLVELNFPVALVAILVVLVASTRSPRRLGGRGPGDRAVQRWWRGRASSTRTTSTRGS